jgi:hypothetical protein
MRVIIIVGPYSNLMSRGLRVLVKKQHFHNTNKTTIKSLFIAPNWRKQSFNVFNFIKRKGHYSLMILLLIGTLLPYAHAQSVDNAFVIRTVNVFPSKVESEGWNNVEAISFQNLDDYALLQEFNSINSATLGQSTMDVPDQKQVSPDTDNEATASPVESQIQTESFDSVSTTTDSVSTTSQALEVVEGIPQEVLFDVPSTSPEESLPEPEISIPKASTAEQIKPLQEVIETDLEPPLENIDPATTTVMKRVTSFFALTVSTVTSLFDSGTSTETISDPDETIDNSESQIDKIVPEIVATDRVLVQGSTTIPVIDAVPVQQTEASSTNLSAVDLDNESEITESSSSTDQIFQDVITESVSTTTEVINREALTSPEENDIETPVNICVENCRSHTILLSDFGYQLDSGIEISGAQLRLSFAAKRKDTREQIPQFTVSYTMDNGLSWLRAGSIVIDDEVSNSINGGYFLYSLPEVVNQAKFDSLEVQLSFADDQAVIDELYVDSVWLELFTLEPPEFEPVDFNELLLDDGFDQDVMSGDNLELPDGSVLDFKFTDENDNESLIIKSNESTYQGLSEVTTYFSVTNTSKKEEDFSIQTYFPAGAGEVTSLQVFDQNKPRKTIIPEYRPYVYHCEAGWEYEGKVIPETIQELSEQLSKKPDSQEVQKEDVEIVTEPIIFDVPTSTATSTIELEEILKNTTTTVLKHLPSITQFLQFSTTTNEKSFLGGDQVEDETDTALTETGFEPTPAESEVLEGVVKTPEVFDNEADSLTEVLETGTEDVLEDDLVSAYSCRNTNVVRECDELDGANTACRLNQVKIKDHEVVNYAPGWGITKTSEGSIARPGLFRRIVEFVGFGPDKKPVPESFEARIHTPDTFNIESGETAYFKMDIEFPLFSRGEYWIEAVGNSEYGLLDPFWSSQWAYRMPLEIDNLAGATTTEQQVFIELDSSYTDFWTNVKSDGGDIRFVQETLGDDASTWYGQNWSERLSITIASTSVLANQTDFPIYVDLSTLGANFFSKVQSSGADIRVTESDGVTELPIEVVSINTVSSVGEMHFKAASISSSSDTTFYIYYDSGSAAPYADSDTYGAENVWTNGFLGVFHLEEDSAGAGNSGLYTDSTSNGYDADDQLTSTGKSGQLGSGQEFDQSANEYIDIPEAMLNGEGDVTTSYWMRTTKTGQQAFVSAPNSTDDNEYLIFQNGETLLGQYSGTVNTSFGTVAVADDSWRYFMLTMDDTADEVRLYVDGLADTENPNALTVSTLTIESIYLGQEQNAVDDCCNVTEAFDGFMDEVRFSDVIRDEAWANTQYLNQSDVSTFYSTSTEEVYVETTFSELDYWIQFFDSTVDETDIWVQTDSLPGAATSSIYVYYGNDTAETTSDEYGPFTYSTSTELYYVTSDLQSNPIVVYSYVDGNEVSIDGGTAVALNSGETTSFATYSSSSVISALGPITAKTNDALSEPPVPISFATTTNLVTTNRTSETFYIHAPFSNADINIYEGANVGETASGTVLSDSTRSFAVDITASDSGILESDEPVLLFHSGTNDSYVAYPPVTRAIFGVYSQNFNYTSIGSTDLGVYCSSGASGTTTMSRGIEESNDFCTSAANGLGNGVMLANATSPIAATQEADGDGGESTRFLPMPEFGTRYILPQDAEYVTVVCAPRFGTSTIEVQTAAGATVDSGTCVPAGSSLPGALNFTPGTQYSLGYQVVSKNDVPFYMYYEENANGDETNTWSAVQAKKYNALYYTVTPGAQEQNQDAQYEQNNYRWYENTNAITPTSPWDIDGTAVAEGEAIADEGSVNSGDELRLRMNLLANGATGSVDSVLFKLQYAEAVTCSAVIESSWYDIGDIGSSTAAFAGLNNSSVGDGTTLSVQVLSDSTANGTYEEDNNSATLPNEVGVGEVVEYDWALEVGAVNANAEYCFRMIRSNEQTIATYTSYPKLLTAGPPELPITTKRFDNEHASSIQPTFEFAAVDQGGDELDYQIEVSTDNTFATTDLDSRSDVDLSDFENIINGSDKSPYNNGELIRFTPASTLTNGVTYWWRVRAIDPLGSNTFGEWTTEQSFKTNTNITVSEWFQATDEQFETNSLTSAITSGSGSVEIDLGGSTHLGEYGSVALTNGATSTVSLNNTYTNPVVVASIRYSRSVPDGDQPAARVFSKTATTFDVKADNFTNDAPGTSTVDYIVMEAGDYLMDNGAGGSRVYATSTSISAIAGSGVPTDPGGLDILFPTSFSSAPAILTMVTTNNDPQWVVSSVYDGYDVSNPPTATQVSVYLNDNLASNGHGSAEDVDIIAFEIENGTTDSIDFDVLNTAATVTDAPSTISFGSAFSSVPEVIVVQQLTMNGSEGSYAMVDLDTLPTATDVTIAAEEGGTAGSRGHSAESMTVVSFDASSGNILRAGTAQMTSTAIDFDDADVGNSWGEVAWNDTGDVTYFVEYQTGSGFQLIPDVDLTGNSVGFTGASINIFNLDTNIYNEIRLVADLSGVSTEVYDWTVSWGQRVEIPELGDPFDNAKIADTTPAFDFTATDPQGDDLEYEISYSTDPTFATATTINSTTTPANFANETTPADTGPFNSGDTVTYTISGGSPLSDNTTYWWRVRAKDSNGGDSFSPWSEADNFTIDTAVTISTWFQTTQAQFTQGEINGVIASTSGSVELSSEVGEYGSATVTANSWTLINTQLTYQDMVVVASPEFSFNSADNGRTVQVRNKTNDSFEIRAENDTESLGGTTVVDYIAIETGDWLIEDGVTGLRVLADTAVSVSNVESASYDGTGGTTVTFSPAFSTAPEAILTISSDTTLNNSKWTSTAVSASGNETTEITTTSMDVSLGISRDTDTVRASEDIDYVVFDTGSGTNNGVLFETLRGTGVDHDDSSVSFNQTFSSAPGVILVHNNANNASDGGFAQHDSDVAITSSAVNLSIAEMGAGAGTHSTENVSIFAFEDSGGTILRDESVNGGLTGTIASEPILFSDGFGPKFEQALIGATTPGNSTTTIQVQYQTVTGSWALIPDVQISSNSIGNTGATIDFTSIDVSTYSVIRLLATLSCDASNCPSIDDWAVEWSEGVTMSGTLKEYDRTTNVSTATVTVSVNGGVPVRTGTVSTGAWSVGNVTAFVGDILTVFVSDVPDANEAVAVFKYDGIGDINGVEMFERHLTLSADETATTSIADLSLSDNGLIGDEDVFFDVDIDGDLIVCAVGTCSDANLYVGSGNAFVLATSTNKVLITHDLVNDGLMELDGNTVKVSGSWDNNSELSHDSSTIIFTATTGTETIDDAVGTTTFNNITFGETSGTTTWQPQGILDINGDLAVDYGTLDRTGIELFVEGAISTAAAGYWSGVETTTFDGAGTTNWSDANPASQDIGYVVIDGAVRTVTVVSNVSASSITVGANDTLNGGGAYDIQISGDFVNTNTFIPSTSRLVVVGESTVSNITTNGNNLYTLRSSTTNGAVAFTESTVTLLGNIEIATGTVTLPATLLSVGGSFNNTGGTFAHNNAEVEFTGTASETIQLMGTVFLSHLYDVSFTGNGDWTFVDTNATTSNDVSITGGTLVTPSGALAIGGSLLNTSGSIAASAGAVKMYSGVAESITPNGSSLYSLLVDGAGTFTITDTNAEVSGDLTVSTGTLVLPSGIFSLGGSLLNNATITPQTGTVLFNSTDTGEMIDLGSSSLYNMNFDAAGGGWTITQNATTTNNFTLTNSSDFTLSSGQFLSVGSVFTNSVGGASTTWSGSTLMLDSASEYEINVKTTPTEQYENLIIGNNTDISSWNSAATSTVVAANGSLYSQDNAGVDGNLFIFGDYHISTTTEYWSYATDFDGVTLGVPREVIVSVSDGSAVSLDGGTLQIIGEE